MKEVADRRPLVLRFRTRLTGVSAEACCQALVLRSSASTLTGASTVFRSSILFRARRLLESAGSGCLIEGPDGDEAALLVQAEPWVRPGGVTRRSLACR